MFMNYIDDKLKPCNWSRWTFLMPAVSVGNVGQLAIDLLISTFRMKKIGYLQSDSILPLVGFDPYADLTGTPTALATSCEVYECVEHKLLVLQQRAPFIKHKRLEFLNNLLEWIKSCQFDKVVLLSSCYAHERMDSQINDRTSFRYLSSPKLNEKDAIKFQEEFKWKHLEKRIPSYIYGDSNNDKPSIYIPGGGITKKMFNLCCDNDIPLAVLLIFCMEGDNIPDSIQLLNHLNSWLQLKGKKDSSSVWEVPVSWCLFFGNEAPSDLY